MILTTAFDSPKSFLSYSKLNIKSAQIIKLLLGIAKDNVTNGIVLYIYEMHHIKSLLNPKRQFTIVAFYFYSHF